MQMFQNCTNIASSLWLTLVCVCYLEEAVDVLPGRAVLHAGVGVLPHHVIDGVHDVHHLLGREREKTNNTVAKSTQRGSRVIQAPLW